MDSDSVIEVKNLSKKFCLNLRRSMYYGSIDVARSMQAVKELQKTAFCIGFGLFVE